MLGPRGPKIVLGLGPHGPKIAVGLGLHGGFTTHEAGCVQAKPRKANGARSHNVFCIPYNTHAKAKHNYRLLRHARRHAPLRVPMLRRRSASARRHTPLHVPMLRRHSASARHTLAPLRLLMLRCPSRALTRRAPARAHAPPSFHVDTRAPLHVLRRRSTSSHHALSRALAFAHAPLPSHTLTRVCPCTCPCSAVRCAHAPPSLRVGGGRRATRSRPCARAHRLAPLRSRPCGCCALMLRSHAHLMLRS